MIYKTEPGRGVKDEKQKYVETERLKKLNKNSVTFVNVNTSWIRDQIWKILCSYQSSIKLLQVCKNVDTINVITDYYWLCYRFYNVLLQNKNNGGLDLQSLNARNSL